MWQKGGALLAAMLAVATISINVRCMTRPRVQSCLAAQETGSELQSESDKGEYSHQPYSTSS